MTIPEFLAALTLKAQSADCQWTEKQVQLAPDRFVLRTLVSPQENPQCPIAFLGEVMIWQTLSAGTRLGLSFPDIIRVVDAADNVPGCDAQLAADLRHAVGLE